jgi:sodium/hydrogen antiporter
VEPWGTFLLAACVILFSVVSRRLARSGVSSFMVFVTLGIVLGSAGLGLLDAERDLDATMRLFEVALALVLFTDATAVRVRQLRHEGFLPMRLLAIGLPLTMILGLVAGLVLLPGIGFWEVALIAVILAPTDAALGLPAIADRRVPRLVRDGLNVESGLNDGIALPFFVIVLTLAEGSRALATVGPLEVVARSLVVTPVLAAGVGWAAGWLLARARRQGSTDAGWSQIAVLGTVAAAYTLAVAVDGSGFIAAWVAGLVFGRVLRRAAAASPAGEPTELAEVVGSLLATASFFLFGALMLGPVLGSLTWRASAYAVLSLTIVRMLAVAAALAGSRLAVPTVGYLGWFGPRGLASVVLGLLAIESELAGTDTLAIVVVTTVGASVFAHGGSARWLASRYGAWCATAALEDPALREAMRPTSPPSTVTHGLPDEER